MKLSRSYILIISAVVLVVLVVGIYTIFYRSSGSTGLPTESSTVVTVNYNDNGFSPNVVNITVPTPVVFVNESSKPFQPVPDPSLIPQGPCSDGNFGACSPIPPGGSITVRSIGYGHVGVWNYFDQLNPANKLIINVQ